MALMLATAALAAAPEAPPTELLARLADHDARMEKLLEGRKVRVHSIGHELDSEGKPTHTVVTELEQERKSGQLTTTVLSAKRDGADDLADEKDRAAKRDKENRRTESPFAARNQGKYAFTVLGRDAQLLHLGFGPKDGPAKEVLTGEAWVDAESGELVKLNMKPSKNPAFVDRLDMKLEYDARVDGARMLSKFSFGGAGGLLMFKKSGDAVLTFSYP